MNRIDGNLYALKQYEEEQEKAERNEEAFLSAVDDDIYTELEDLHYRFILLTDKYNIEYSFEQYISECL